MIPFDEALRLMMESASFQGAERVPLPDSLGRVLAEDVLSDVDMPPFDKSAMDGFACRKEDLALELTVLEEIPAGSEPKKRIGPGQCSSIMTGAPVPMGADCVLMREYAEKTAGGRVRATVKETAANICRRAEDIRSGDAVLKKGAVVSPAAVAMLATVGCVEPMVARLPRVSVLATGSELVDPSARPSGAQIRNSNGFQIAAQVSTLGIKNINAGMVPDTREALGSAIRGALGVSDVLIVSGGVSEGDYDFVPEMLSATGFRFLFESVAMQPGRPTLFGVNGSKYCCGLPGNPVSTFIAFELLMRPFLYALMGHAFAPRIVAARLAKAVKGKKGGRQVTIPVAFSAPGEVVPVEYHGSAHLAAMPRADAILTIPAGGSFGAGEMVHVRQV